MSTTRSAPPAACRSSTSRREFDAPRDLVFRAYTDPSCSSSGSGRASTRWSSTTYESATAARWRYVHRDDDGTSAGFHGVFHGDADAGRHGPDLRVRGRAGPRLARPAEFEDRDGRTIVRTHSVFQSVEARDAMVEHGMAEGMNDGFDRLDELLARLATPV